MYNVIIHSGPVPDQKKKKTQVTRSYQTLIRLHDLSHHEIW